MPDDTHPCADCGLPYFERMGGYWIAPDGLWNEIVGTDTIALCPSCFARRTRTAGIVLRWEAMEDVA